MELEGLEPSTSRLPAEALSQLSYSPDRSYCAAQCTTGAARLRAGRTALDQQIPAETAIVALSRSAPLPLQEVPGARHDERPDEVA